MKTILRNDEEPNPVKKMEVVVKWPINVSRGKVQVPAWGLRINLMLSKAKKVHADY